MPNVQYVHPNGDDANDGTSWTTSKKTVLAAYDGLDDGGGDIYIAPNSYIGSETNSLKLFGAFDWHYTATGWRDFDGTHHTVAPFGWRKEKAVRFIGAGGFTGDVQATAPAANLIGGMQSDGAHLPVPAIWLSGTAAPLAFINLNIVAPLAVVIGRLSGEYLPLEENEIILSDGTHVSTDTLTYCVSFTGCILRGGQGTFSLNGAERFHGPAVEVRPGAFISICQSSIVANGLAPLGEIRARAGIWIYGAEIKLEDLNMFAGGVVYKNSGSNWRLSARRISLEQNNIPSPPVVRVINPDSTGTGIIEAVGISDATPEGTIGDVIIEGNAVPPTALRVTGAGRVVGPAILLDQASAGWVAATVSPATHRQVGFWPGGISGQHDAARRVFPPVVARFPNLVHDDLRTIAQHSGSAGVEIDILGPDGSLNAVTVKTLDGEDAFRDIIVTQREIRVGDYVIAGAWVRGVASPLHSAPIVLGVSSGVFDNGASACDLGVTFAGDGGDWRWLSGVYRIDRVLGNPAGISMSVRANARNTTGLFAPILLHVPAGVMSDNEAHDWTQQLNTYPGNVPPGALTGLSGQDFAVQRHLLSRSLRPPAVQPGQAARRDAMALLNGTDMAGVISINQKTALNPGEVMRLKFAFTYTAIPSVTISPADPTAALAQTYVEASTTGFAIHCLTVPLKATTLKWNYHVIENGSEEHRL